MKQGSVVSRQLQRTTDNGSRTPIWSQFLFESLSMIRITIRVEWGKDQESSD